MPATPVLTIRGLPAALLASLEHSADEHERSLEGEVRYALKVHARAGWRVHGTDLPGPLSPETAFGRTLKVRILDPSVMATIRQFAAWNCCKPREEVLHALARYIHGARVELQRPTLSADEQSAHALVEAIQQQGR